MSHKGVALPSLTVLQSTERPAIVGLNLSLGVVHGTPDEQLAIILVFHPKKGGW